MLKLHNRNTGRRRKIYSKLRTKTPERRHWPCSDVFIVNFTYFTIYSSASIVDFGQVNIGFEPVLWISIYPRAERRHCTTAFLVNFKHISHLVLLFLFLSFDK